MKKLLWIFLLFPSLAYAQQYTRGEIKHASDSILRSFVGDKLFSYSKCELTTDNYVYYRYINKNGKTKYSEVPRNSKYTKGNFVDIAVWYKLKYPYPKCTICDTVRGETFVTLNRWLDMKKSPDISFIPDYVLENDSCHYTVRH